MSDAKPFFKMKFDGEVYELDKLTLGESRLLKRRFGLADLRGFDIMDPDQLVGLIALAVKRKDPTLTIEQAESAAEALDVEGAETIEKEGEEPDPSQAASGGEPESSSESGSPETSPETPGSPSSESPASDPATLAT